MAGTATSVPGSVVRSTETAHWKFSLPVVQRAATGAFNWILLLRDFLLSSRRLIRASLSTAPGRSRARITGLLLPRSLPARVLVWAEEQARLGKLPRRAGRLLEAILYRGESPRGEVTNLLGIPERSARRITSELLQQGIFASESTRAPLRLASLSRWLPAGCPAFSLRSQPEYPERFSVPC